MRLIDYLVLGVLVIAVLSAAAFTIHRRKKGKSSCGYSCRSCPYSEECKLGNKKLK